MAGELGALNRVRSVAKDILTTVQTLRDRGQDAQVEYGEVSASAGAWTTVVSLTPNVDRRVVSFGADVAALLSTNYRFRLQLDGVTKWQEVAGTTSIGVIPMALNVPANSTVAVQGFHNEASATTIGGSISHVTA